ncbi:unnamed protein product [Brassica rapa]|uniref:Uncharacterized protein n=2 Tax=Brassica TaxID=3705 RepID=A0A8D9GMB8_BRACM|nr:unnamed protein product [Brassica napus]CAG7883439.1 unnamed protein product [Brassica rapa]
MRATPRDIPFIAVKSTTKSPLFYKSNAVEDDGERTQPSKQHKLRRNRIQRRDFLMWV